jgi:hypothetical protein
MTRTALSCWLVLSLGCGGSTAGTAPPPATPAEAPAAAALEAPAEAAPPPTEAGQAAARKEAPVPGGMKLEVLPANLSRDEVEAIMSKAIAPALGVKCEFCHDTKDFAKDTPHKSKARDMMRMAGGINQQFFAGQPRVTCMTCHDGHEEPAGGK